MKKKIAWALLDNRTGNRNQVLGILSQLDFEYKIIEIKYNFFSILPNFFFQILSFNFHIKSISSQLVGKKPNLIISCGRRTATVSIELKKKLNHNLKCVHLMYPRFTLFKKEIDMIFTPMHDSVKENKYIKKFLGTPSNITLSKNTANKYIQPIIFLIIGGDHGRFKLSEKEVENIILKVILKIKNVGTLLITTSRRSSKKVINKVNYIAKKYSVIKEVYHPFLMASKDNIYLKGLSISKEIVVTGDSMSMISEACETKKPVRIYYNTKFCSKKHIRFCNKLIKDKYAFPFEAIGKKNTTIKVLNTSKKIALCIKKNLNHE